MSTDLLFQYRVDMCITGHVHAYQRTKPVYQYHNNPEGPVHITLGTGGTPEGLINHWVDWPDWCARETATGVSLQWD